VSDEGRLVAGRYRVVQRIGSGAMGAVWQAHDEVLARTVAIKQLLLQPGLDQHEAEDARQRTMREGRIAARLHHPNAITVFDVVTDDNGQPCLIMEYLESTSLAALLQENKTLPPMEVGRIGAQIASALKEAHAVGIVHRDIKPGNILLANTGMVKITDFGISRAKDDVTVTKTGMIAGTPAYLAPEVAIGGEPGPESDVFSLGSTLYAACEGQPPFGLSENTLGLLHAVAAGQINPPRQSGPLASVLAVLLHPDVHHRPTAEEAEELLDAVSRGETPLGVPHDATSRMPGGSGGGMGALGAGAAGAALGGMAGYGAAQAYGGHDGMQGNAMPGNGMAGTLGAGPMDPTRRAFYEEPDDYAPGSGYPEEDYDRAPGTTRAVPAGHGGYDDYQDDYRDYDDYHDGYDDPPPRRSALDEGDERGRWKKPAVIGGIVLVALVAMGVWLFSPKNGREANHDQKTPPLTSSSQLPTLTSDSSSIEDSTTDETKSKSKNSSSRRTSRSELPPPVTPRPPPPRTSSQSPPTSDSSTTTTPSGGNSGG
jgi:tRNA A-37 threonylcarbamoyl transferase component Bud32